MFTSKISDVNKTFVQKRPADPFIRGTCEEIKRSLFCSRLQGKNDAVRSNLPSRTDIMSLIFHIDCGCRVLNREGGRGGEATRPLMFTLKWAKCSGIQTVSLLACTITSFQSNPSASYRVGKPPGLFCCLHLDGVASEEAALARPSILHAINIPIY